MPSFVNLDELNAYLAFMHPIVTSKSFATVMDAVVWMNVCVLMLEHKGMSPALKVCIPNLATTPHDDPPPPRAYAASLQPPSLSLSLVVLWASRFSRPRQLGISA